jgi:hypothetical protein
MTNLFVSLISWLLGIPHDWDEDWELRRDRDINDE